MPATRRTFLTYLPALAGASAALVACGSEPAAGPTSAGASPTASSAGVGAFPSRVEHQFGTAEIPSAPVRVVCVGLTEQDVLLQLGVVPVAVTEWYGDQPSATWPWAHDLLAGAEPEVLDAGDGIDFERVAALAPDLIIGTNAGMTQADYDLLSAIAPTVSSVEGSTAYFSSWPDQTLQIARALGREADGQDLIAQVQASYAAAAAAHPEWRGLSATFAQGGPYDGQLYVYPEGLGTSFLTDLGFTITAGLEGFAPDVGSQAQISAENVALIDADVIVFATEDKEMFDKLQDFSTVSSLTAVAEGRAVYTDSILAGAIYFLTPLSLQYVLDRLTPMLEQASNGDVPTSFPTT